MSEVRGGNGRIKLCGYFSYVESKHETSSFPILLFLEFQNFGKAEKHTQLSVAVEKTGKTQQRDEKSHIDSYKPIFRLSFFGFSVARFLLNLTPKISGSFNPSGPQAIGGYVVKGNQRLDQSIQSKIIQYLRAWDEYDYEWLNLEFFVSETTPPSTQSQPQNIVPGDGSQQGKPLEANILEGVGGRFDPEGQ